MDVLCSCATNRCRSSDRKEEKYAGRVEALLINHTASTLEKDETDRQTDKTPGCCFTLLDMDAVVRVEMHGFYWLTLLLFKLLTRWRQWDGHR